MTVVSFDGTNGMYPWSTLVQGTDGNFYGTTELGGAYGSGTVFRLSREGVFTTLHSFDGVSDGAYPLAGLVQAADGSLYGTTSYGPGIGYNGFGTVFKISTNGVLNLFFSFNGTDGAQPWNGALVQGSDGSLYGTTSWGGATTNSSGGTFPPGFGTVFRITTDGTFTNLALFNWNDGFSPYGGVTEGTDGNFYGTTSGGGVPLPWGTVFKITPDGQLTTLFSFNGSNGLTPFSAPLKSTNGNFLGTTTQGGSSYGDNDSVNGQGFGTIFKLDTNGVFTSFFSFQRTNGSYPYATLVQGRDGYFYGTTLSGGAYTNQLFGDTGYAGFGTVFRLTTDGKLTTLVSFDDTNGAEPVAGLTLGKDGSFYGTTIRGGAFDFGTIFRLSLSQPAVVCTAPVTVECGIPAQFTAHVSDPIADTLTVVWSVNGALAQTNAIPPGDAGTEADVSFSAALPVGTNTISVSVTDEEHNSASCSSAVVAQDMVPPVVLSARATPDILWPPNHQMVTVRVNAVAVDNCSVATWKVVRVLSNEPIASSRPDKSPDWIIIDDHTVALRAERNVRGTERIYRIEIQAADVTGNLSRLRTVIVRVPGRTKGYDHLSTKGWDEEISTVRHHSPDRGD